MIGTLLAHSRITGKLGERIARFAREARVLASRNHPNLAAIYGVEDNALVMELVVGEMLGGPLPVPTVIDYAHEKGIVHRDLKPANINVGVILGTAAYMAPEHARGDTSIRVVLNAILK